MQDENKKIRVGIDLGGTNIKIGLVDQENEIIASTSIPTYAEREAEAIVQDMADAVKGLFAEKQLTLADCAGVGIGSPGTIDSATGTVLYSNNIKWENVPLAGLLKERLELEVEVDNDANCAALGEAKAGAAKGCENAVLLTLGTGVGSGVIYHGELLKKGGELGHLILVKNGKMCSCGRRGCVEAYASASALVRDAKEAAAANKKSLLNKLCVGNLENMNGEIPFRAAKQGDETAVELVSSYIQSLAELATDVANCYHPEKILFGGGVCAQGEYLTRPIEEYVKDNVFGGKYMPKVEIGVARLGNKAGIIGAANLVSIEAGREA